jgi:hypothetical protein
MREALKLTRTLKEERMQEKRKERRGSWLEVCPLRQESVAELDCTRAKSKRTFHEHQAMGERGVTKRALHHTVD